MNRIVYLNGQYVPESEAVIPVFDRAVLFGDAVYDVVAVLEGRFINYDNHFLRLARSLDAVSIPCPVDRDGLLDTARELVARNRLSEGAVYVQVSRGIEDRDFLYGKDIAPSLFMFTQEKAVLNHPGTSGIGLKSVPDIRWARRDIKSTNLLGQVLAKAAAREAGAQEVLMIEADGHVTECGSSSFFILKDKRIITRPLSRSILPGVTRKALIALCRSHRIPLEERRFTLDEVHAADEAFLSSASSLVLPVVRVDDRPVGDGRPGPVYATMRENYIRYAMDSGVSTVS